MLTVDPSNEEEAKRKVARFRDEANKCVSAVIWQLPSGTCKMMCSGNVGSLGCGGSRQASWQPSAGLACLPKHAAAPSAHIKPVKIPARPTF